MSTTEQACLRLDAFKTSQEWFDAITARLKEKYRHQTYWINTDNVTLPTLNTLLNGWLAVYARPGNNEADVVCMDWIKEPRHRWETHTVLRLITAKSEKGLEHALEIAHWLTMATYSCKAPT